jgi:uncharacterized membrane protein
MVVPLHAVVFVLVLYALALAALADVPGVRPIAPRTVAVLVGLFFVGVGNLLPRTRPNLLIGIRSTRTSAIARCGCASIGRAGI